MAIHKKSLYRPDTANRQQHMPVGGEHGRMLERMELIAKGIKRTRGEKASSKALALMGLK